MLELSLLKNIYVRYSNKPYEMGRKLHFMLSWKYKPSDALSRVCMSRASLEHIIENQSDLGSNQEDCVKKKQLIKDLDFTICKNGHKSSTA